MPTNLLCLLSPVVGGYWGPGARCFMQYNGISVCTILPRNGTRDFCSVVAEAMLGRGRL